MPWLRAVVLAVFLFPALAGVRSGATAQDALVLGGGGSRGLAHAGAIKGLTEKGFRPELVVGTSMGAIMGALYASGLTADSIWQLSRSLDWQELFAFPRFRTVPDGEPARPFLNFGLRVNRDRYAEGLVADRQVNRLLVLLLFDAGARARSDFDRLPIRYRSVASDLATGTVVPLARGDFALAVRSSMAVPGLFAPVITDDGRYLVDGGMTDYLPVVTAREAGAERIVAVDVIRPPADKPGRRNPFQVALRAFRLTLRNARPDGPEPDVTIEPVIDPDLSAAIFLRDATPLLEAGRNAALESFPDSLARPAGSGSENWRQAAGPPVHVSGLRIELNDPALGPFVEHAFRRLADAPYDPARVLDTVDRLYASDYFNGIWPRIEEDGALVVRAVAQPSILASAAAGYDDDLGSRIFAGLRARRGTAEFAAAGRLGAIESYGSLSARRPFLNMPTVASVAGFAYRERDVRIFEAERIVAESKVRRAGGWAGLRWSGPNGRGELMAAFRADRIRQDQGENGTGIGVSVRVAGVEPNARVVGTPTVLEVERRWGEVAWSDLRARGSVEAGVDRLRVAVLGDIAVASPDAPLDALPALGFENGIPGLRVASERGPARLVAGLDLAWPVLLEGYARLRLRTGARAHKLDEMDRAKWMSGMDLGLIWWTPFGRIAVGVGANQRGDWRAAFDIGPRL